MLELAAIHHPDTLAVVDCAAGSERQLTYAQLFERAAGLAAHLRGAGLRRGDRVGLLSRNSSQVIELHFAAAAIHAVVVNLNIHLAPPELAFILQDSAPRLVFADTHCAPALLAAHAQLRAEAAAGQPAVVDSVVWMHVDGSSAVLPAAAEGLQAFEYEAYLAAAAAAASSSCGGGARGQLAGICAEVLAEGSEEDGYHLYYTSGTTGRPKGVLLSHRVVVRHAVGTIKGERGGGLLLVVLVGTVPAAASGSNGRQRRRQYPACASQEAGMLAIHCRPHISQPAPCLTLPACHAEMGLNRHDVWGHFAPMFHLVDVFAVYAITLVGGRHVTLPTFSPQEALLAIGAWRGLPLPLPLPLLLPLVLPPPLPSMLPSHCIAHLPPAPLPV